MSIVYIALTLGLAVVAQILALVLAFHGLNTMRLDLFIPAAVLQVAAWITPRLLLRWMKEDKTRELWFWARALERYGQKPVEEEETPADRPKNS